MTIHTYGCSKSAIVWMLAVTLCAPFLMREAYHSHHWGELTFFSIALLVMILINATSLLMKFDITDEGITSRLGRLYTYKTINRVRWKDVVLLEDDAFAGLHLYKFWVREELLSAESRRWHWGRLETPDDGRLCAIFSVNNVTFARPVELLRDIVWRVPPEATIAPSILQRTGLIPADIGKLSHFPT